MIRAKLEVDKLKLQFLPQDFEPSPDMGLYAKKWIEAIYKLPADVKGELEERLRGV